jgi:hypothetical protein
MTIATKIQTAEGSAARVQSVAENRGQYSIAGPWLWAGQLIDLADRIEHVEPLTGWGQYTHAIRAFGQGVDGFYFTDASQESLAALLNPVTPPSL